MTPSPGRIGISMLSIKYIKPFRMESPGGHLLDDLMNRRYAQ